VNKKSIFFVFKRLFIFVTYLKFLISCILNISTFSEHLVLDLILKYNAFGAQWKSRHRSKAQIWKGLKNFVTNSQHKYLIQYTYIYSACIYIFWSMVVFYSRYYRMCLEGGFRLYSHFSPHLESHFACVL